MKHQNGTRRKGQWIYRILLIAAVSMMAVGAYLLLMPKWIRYNQDKIRQQLLDQVDDGDSDDIIWVDPDAWVNSQEEVDSFVPDPSDPSRYIESHKPTSTTVTDSDPDSTTNSGSDNGNGSQSTDPTTGGSTSGNNSNSNGGTSTEYTPNPTNENGQIGLQAIGRLVITKIGVNSPIVTGLSRPTLRYAAAHYEITPMIGDKGITAIFAHRHPDHGRDLNRLNEVQAGDRFEIVRNKKTYHYLVQQNVVVKPAQVFDYIFGNYNDDDYVMLVTCDPIPTWQNRMIVIAKFVEITD